MRMHLDLFIIIRFLKSQFKTKTFRILFFINITLSKSCCQVGPVAPQSPYKCLDPIAFDHRVNVLPLDAPCFTISLSLSVIPRSLSAPSFPRRDSVLSCRFIRRRIERAQQPSTSRREEGGRKSAIASSSFLTISILLLSIFYIFPFLYLFLSLFILVCSPLFPPF